MLLKPCSTLEREASFANTKPNLTSSKTMCGIVGYVGKQKAVSILLEGLKRLEYRGYDSAGVCILQDRKLDVAKKAGRVENLVQEVAKHRLNGTTGIGHTRCATHGGVT